MSLDQIQSLLSGSLPYLLDGAKITVFLSIVSLFFGIILGITFALARHLKIPILGRIGDAYVSIFRGTPLLVQLYVIYYGLPQIGVAFGPLFSGALGLSLNTGAYLAESFRAALEAVPSGQYEGGYSIGLTRAQLMRYVILPQSIRTALPTIGNTFINLVKDTSLVSAITVTELLQSTTLVIARTFQPLPLYIEAAIIYWLINFVFSYIQSYFERLSSRHV